jgi:hypothetical protein
MPDTLCRILYFLREWDGCYTKRILNTGLNYLKKRRAFKRHRLFIYLTIQSGFDKQSDSIMI